MGYTSTYFKTYYWHLPRNRSVQYLEECTIWRGKNNTEAPRPNTKQLALSHGYPPSLDLQEATDIILPALEAQYSPIPQTNFIADVEGVWSPPVG